MGMAFNLQDIKLWRSGITLEGKPPIQYISEDLLGAAEEILTLKKQIDDSNAKVRDHENHIKEVFNNQSRLRENIKSMQKMTGVAKLIDRYMEDLNREEDDLISTRDSISKLKESIRITNETLSACKVNLSLACDKLKKN